MYLYLSLASLPLCASACLSVHQTVPPRAQLQALDIAMKEFFTDARHFITLNRSFFSKTDPDAEVALGNGAVCWTGYFAAVHSTQSGLRCVFVRVFIRVFVSVFVRVLKAGNVVVVIVVVVSVIGLCDFAFLLW